MYEEFKGLLLITITETPVDLFLSFAIFIPIFLPLPPVGDKFLLHAEHCI